jgi:hypothetical protein
MTIYKFSLCEHILEHYSVKIYETSRCGHARIYYSKRSQMSSHLLWYHRQQKEYSIYFAPAPVFMPYAQSRPHAEELQISSLFPVVLATFCLLYLDVCLVMESWPRSEFTEEGPVPGFAEGNAWEQSSRCRVSSAPWVLSLWVLSQTVECCCLRSSYRTEWHPLSEAIFYDLFLRVRPSVISVSVISYMLGSVPESPLVRNYVTASVSHISQVSIIIQKTEKMIYELSRLPTASDPCTHPQNVHSPWQRLVWASATVLCSISKLCAHPVYKFPNRNTLSRVRATLNGVLDWILDLLTTYTYDSELQAITAPTLISTL